jgi:exonuclease VII small subunit
MRKEIAPLTPLEDAIKTLEEAIESLDDMIEMMQKNQEQIRGWLTPGKPIGWIEQDDK